MVASAAADQTIGLWRSATTRCERVLPTAATLLAFSADSQWLASAGEKSTIVLWDVNTGLPHSDFLGHEAPASALSFSPSGDGLMSGSRDGTICIWPLTQPAAAQVLTATSARFTVWPLAPMAPN
ncbi:MAG: hypothetical protein HC929_06200 [Leptolyngbyaceae cyanobacterium SM2_5_2]|nr:hypothetical protein [Leptolyngbyaceae cyanobacterium SM2_5_2]